MIIYVIEQFRIVFFFCFFRFFIAAWTWTRMSKWLMSCGMYAPSFKILLSYLNRPVLSLNDIWLTQQYDCKTYSSFEYVKQTRTLFVLCVIFETRKPVEIAFKIIVCPLCFQQWLMPYTLAHWHTRNIHLNSKRSQTVGQVQMQQKK